MEADLIQYVRRAENAEIEIQKLVKELEGLEKERFSGSQNPQTEPKAIQSHSNKSAQGNYTFSKNICMLKKLG